MSISAEDPETLVEGRIPFRLRIGVTGHRDPADQERAKAGIRHRLEEIRDRFPASDETAVVVEICSALAEGADRLAISVAREVFDRTAVTVELHAVLPFEPADYELDFETSELRMEFADLLHDARVEQMPASRSRDQAYERAGRRIVDRCDVIVAIWDGRESRRRGGTGETARYARLREVPVLVVGVERASTAGESSRIVHFEDTPGAFDALTERHRRLAEFNRGSVRAGKLRAQLDSQDGRLLALAGGTEIQWPYERASEWALPRMIRADALALKHQWLHYKLGEMLFVLAALAVTSVALQLWIGLADAFALVEVGLMLMALGTYAAARWLAAHERWIGYRSLAEAFRSSLFIVMTGAGRETDAPKEPWYQRAFSDAWERRPGIAPESSQVHELRNFVIRAWIDDQVSYHEQARQHLARSRRTLTYLVLLLFGATVVAGVLHAFALLTVAQKALVFAAIALPGFGAALTGIRDQRQHRVHEHRCERTAVRLRQLERDLISRASLHSLQVLIAQVQSVLEEESIEWSGVVEFQELELVV